MKLVKSTIAVLLALLCAAAMFACKGKTAGTSTAGTSNDPFSFLSNGISFSKNSNGGVTVTKYSGKDTELEIPATINELPVNEIGYEAFRDTLLTKLTIPDSVTYIDRFAFYNSTALADINLSDKITFVGEDAFTLTAWLNAKTDEFVIVGDGILIDYNGAGGEVNIPDTVKQISRFNAPKTDISVIYIPSSVTSVGEKAFKQNFMLKSVVFPDSVMSIGKGTFKLCKALTSVVLPKGITEIPDEMFYACSAIPEFTVPDTVTKIGNDVFFACKSLNTITIPDSVTEIGTQTLAGCGELTVRCGSSEYVKSYAQSSGLTVAPIG